jgi:hypothetical protein
MILSKIYQKEIAERFCFVLLFKETLLANISELSKFSNRAMHKNKLHISGM